MTTLADIPPGIFDEAETVKFDGSQAENIDRVPETGSGLYCDETGCNTELFYSGRGRKPKKCDVHKKSRSTSDKSPGSQAPRGIGKIREDWKEMQYTIGVLVAPYDQYDAAVLITTAPKIADSIALLAARYPEFRKWLEKGGDGMMWVKIAMALASVVIPIGAHHGIVPMDEQMAYRRFVDPSA